MTTLQTKLLELLKFTIAFLDAHNLRYIALGGTALGAVRHKGFIPWDDDIDIHMWREDYNKLLSLKSELQRDGHDVLSADTDCGYYLPFAKIIDSSTTIWEFEEFPFVMGLFVDIFPLDRFDDLRKLKRVQLRRRLYFSAYQGSLKGVGLIQTVKLFADYIKHRRIRDSLFLWRDMFNRGRSEKCLMRWKKFEASYYGQSGEYCDSPLPYKGRVLRTEWFERTQLVPFEDTMILVPKDYDAYLTEIYGDWRTLPPEEKRRETHMEERHYINLREGLCLSEVKARLLLGEKEVY